MRTMAWMALGMVCISGCAVPAEDAAENQAERLAPTSGSQQAQENWSYLTAPQGEPDGTCQLPMGWAITSASLGPSAAPTFPPEIASMIAAGHPFSIGVEPTAGGLLMRASGTLTNQSGDEFFPAVHPADATPMNVDAAVFSSASPANHAWFHFVDGKSAMIWVPLIAVNVSGQFPTGCRDHVSGVLDAVIPEAAADIVVTTSAGDVTLGDVLPVPSPIAGGGWPIHIVFQGNAAIVLPPS